jgi:hypothetical protein
MDAFFSQVASLAKHVDILLDNITMTVFGLAVTAKPFAFQREDTLPKTNITASCFFKVYSECTYAFCACVIFTTNITPTDGVRISQPAFYTWLDSYGTPVILSDSGVILVINADEFTLSVNHDTGITPCSVRHRSGRRPGPGRG